MSNPNISDENHRRPTAQELRTVQLAPQQRRAFMFMGIGYAGAVVIMLGLSAWFYAGGDSTMAFWTLVAGIVGGLGGVYVIRMLTRQAKLRILSEDPLHRHH